MAHLGSKGEAVAQSIVVNWSQLVPDLLIQIAQTMTLYEDFDSFSRVCTSWESAAAATPLGPKRPSRYPCLMLAPERKKKVKESDDDDGGRNFLYLSNGGLVVNLTLPEATSQRTCVSSDGWLLTIHVQYSNLVHPFSRRQINLPNLDTFPNFQQNTEFDRCLLIKKVLFSSNPSFSDDDFLVMVIWGGNGKLGFCRPGDHKWTATTDQHWPGPILDITYHRGKLYALSYCMILVHHDIHGSDPTMLSKVADLPHQLVASVSCRHPSSPIYQCSYMLALPDNDKFLIILREVIIYDKLPVALPYDMEYYTNTFQVFEFNLSNGQWLKLETLGNRAVFLGFNSTFAIEASSDGGIIKPDCIYFTDDSFTIYWQCYLGGGRDMGIYHMSDGSVEPLFNGESRSQISPPMEAKELWDRIQDLKGVNKCRPGLEK